jgi:stringent starvation protein B
MSLKDPRPYVLWAHIQWLDESNAKPHIAIQNGPKTMFPPAFQAHSVVTFNVSAEAVNGLQLDENGLSFSARFSGKEFKVYAPLDCLLQLNSADGQIRIGLQPQQNQQPQSSQTEVVQEQQEKQILEQPTKTKPTLAVITGGASDGVARGKLSIVPKSAPPDEPFEPECA